MNYNITHFALKMPIVKWISNERFLESVEYLKKTQDPDLWIIDLYGC